MAHSDTNGVEVKLSDDDQSEHENDEDFSLSEDRNSNVINQLDQEKSGDLTINSNELSTMNETLESTANKDEKVVKKNRDSRQHDGTYVMNKTIIIIAYNAKGCTFISQFIIIYRITIC